MIPIENAGVGYIADRSYILRSLLSAYAPQTGDLHEAKKLMEKNAGNQKGSDPWKSYFGIVDLAISPPKGAAEVLSEVDRYVKLRAYLTYLKDPVPKPVPTFGESQFGKFGSLFEAHFHPVPAVWHGSISADRLPGRVGPATVTSRTLQSYPPIAGRVGSPTGGAVLFDYPILNTSLFRPSLENAVNAPVRIFVKRGSFEYFFSDPFKNVRSKIGNRTSMIEAMKEYPWPPPPTYFERLWISDVSPTPPVLEFLDSETVFSKRKARSVVTLSLMANYDKLSEKVSRELEEKKKRGDRKAMILKIALVVWSIPIAIAAAPIIQAAVGAVTKGFSFAQQRIAAKDLVNAAEQFAESDAAFSLELDRVAAELEAGAPPEHEAAYSLVVEGEEVGASSTVEGIAKLASDTVKPGDRFEVLLDGESLGLNIATSSGSVHVPEDAVEEVVKKSPDEIQSAVKRVERGRFPWELLLGIPAAYAISKGI